MIFKHVIRGQYTEGTLTMRSGSARRRAGSGQRRYGTFVAAKFFIDIKRCEGGAFFLHRQIALPKAVVRLSFAYSLKITPHKIFKERLLYPTVLLMQYPAGTRS